MQNVQFTVVHVTNRVGTMSVPGGASYMWCMSKDFLGFIPGLVHTDCTKREYWWEFVVWLLSLILHPKNTKVRKSGILGTVISNYS